MASPLCSNNYQYFTGDYICIRHMICVLLVASCMICVFACFILCFKSSILAGHTCLREPKLCHDLLVALYASLKSFMSYGLALVLHLYLFEHGVLSTFVEIIVLSHFTYIILGVLQNSMVICFGYKF